MDESLECKLRELVDRQEIWSVLLRYSRGLDRLDREMVRSCYYEDAIDDHHVFVGKVEDFIDWAFDYSIRCNTVHHHGIGNHYCELDGDNAYSETYYTFIGANLQPPHLLSMGRYIDHFQRRGGLWRIANRVCVIEKHFDLIESQGNAVDPTDPRLGAPRPASRDRNDLSYHRPVVPRRPPVPTRG